MAKLLDGKTALVTGVANRWSLAFAIASAFRREGARVALTYQGERQKLTVEELAAELGCELVASCDVTQDADLEALRATVGEKFGKLDAVMHSIAFANREDLSRPFVETSRDGFALAHDVSAYSLVALARALSPLMTGGGSITTLTYLGATRVVTNYNVMGVAKAALEACVRYLASELGPKNIRVNGLSAGPIKTLAAAGIPGFSTMLQAYRDRAPLRRNMELSELGDAAAFLLSPQSRGITGEIMLVDGGYNTVGL